MAKSDDRHPGHEQVYETAAIVVLPRGLLELRRPVRL